MKRTIAAVSVLVVAGLATVVGAGQAVAYESSPVGYGSMNGGTTGGAGGTTVTASTAAQFISYATSSTRYIIRVTGTITLSSMQKVASNKTIVGVGTSGRITGYGLNFSGVKNIIVRNMNFSGSKDDSINVQDGSTNLWFDHNDLSAGYDGLLDIKRGSDYITVSWNKFHNHDKTALLGHSDSNGSQDIGHLRVTYVHNWFDGTTQRHPRVRFGNVVHILNNYYRGATGYGVASTCGAGVYVERNYFENVSKPVVSQTGDSPSGNVKLLNNYLVNSGTPVERNPGSVASVPYSYTPEANNTVKATVTAGAGVGKVS